MKDSDISILSLDKQTEAWRKASRKMRWRIRDQEFEHIGALPSPEENKGIVLCHGFGDNGAGHADAVLSGRLAWEYAWKTRKRGTVWQSPYIDFNKPDAFRLRPSAPPRPKGFYVVQMELEIMPGTMAAAEALKSFRGMTGWGPEGFQFLCVTHAHFPDLMSERKIPFMALADYEVAPYGFNDFMDAPQLFSSNGILGLGIGNIEQRYPGFAVPGLVLLPVP